MNKKNLAITCAALSVLFSSAYASTTMTFIDRNNLPPGEETRKDYQIDINRKEKSFTTKDWFKTAALAQELGDKFVAIHGGSNIMIDGYYRSVSKCAPQKWDEKYYVKCYMR